MIKKTVILAPLCLMLLAPAALAQDSTSKCSTLAEELTHSQQKIDNSRKAYNTGSRIIDEQLSQANTAAQNGDSLDAVWPDVLSSRDALIPLAEEALSTVNAGFALMQNYASSGCTTATATELENRRLKGASRYESGLIMLKKIPTDWHKYLGLGQKSAAPDPATCMALEQGLANANAKAEAYSLKHDAFIATYRKARVSVNTAIDFARPFAEDWDALLEARKIALPGMQGYLSVINAVFAPSRRGLDNGCVQMSAEDAEAFNDNANEVLTEIKESLIRMQDMPLDAQEYILNRNETTTPRVGIINHTQNVLCIHTDAQTIGHCLIEPLGSRVFELSDGKTEDVTISPVITGVDNGQKICTTRTFDHKSGSKIWVVEAVVEEGCAFSPVTDQE